MCALWKRQVASLFLQHWTKQSRLLSDKIGKNGGPEQPPSDPKIYRITDNIDPTWEEDPQFDYASENKPKRDIEVELNNEYFGLGELRNLLLQENIKDMLFLRLPDGHMCDYMVIGSGISRSHIRSAATLVYKALKQKRRTSSLSLPRVEGLDSPCEWIAIDMGNVLLNLFTPSVREHYNLEALWVADPVYDEISQAKSKCVSEQPSVRAIDWDKLIQNIQQKRKADKSDEQT